jgi:hypothetical protein
MHNLSLRSVTRAGVAAAFLVLSCGLALADPGGGHGGGGFHGGFGGHGGGFGGFHGGGFGHGGFDTMDRGGFRMHSRSFGHSTHFASTHHTRHHTRFANNGMPRGFSHGNASWKKNGGTPPGWSHGNKTGWGCTPGRKNCMPPGLAKKQDNQVNHHTRTASHMRKHSRLTPVSDKTPNRLRNNSEPQ